MRWIHVLGILAFCLQHRQGLWGHEHFYRFSRKQEIGLWRHQSVKSLTCKRKATWSCWSFNLPFRPSPAENLNETHGERLPLPNAHLQGNPAIWRLPVMKSPDQDKRSIRHGVSGKRRRVVIMLNSPEWRPPVFKLPDQRGLPRFLRQHKPNAHLGRQIRSHVTFEASNAQHQHSLCLAHRLSELCRSSSLPGWS